MKKFKAGMYGGKFMPFHKGHLYCVEQASKMCEKLYVILFVGGEQEIKILKKRHEKWLQRCEGAGSRMSPEPEELWETLFEERCERRHSTKPLSERS